jgi:hypothetical protein
MLPTLHVLTVPVRKRAPREPEEDVIIVKIRE